MKKLVRTSTVAISLDVLLKGQLRFLNTNFEVVAVSGEDEHLRKVQNREQVRTIAVHFERKIAPLKDLVSLFKLYRVLKKEKPFIIHSITPKAGLLSMIAGYFAGVPIRMHTFTGLIFPSKTGAMQRLLIATDQLLCLFATHIYPEGNGVKADLIRYNITKKPLKIIAHGNVNGIDCDYFDSKHFDANALSILRNDLNISKDDFVFIFVGRLVQDKGINEAIAAFVRFCETRTDVKLLLVGPFEQHLDPIKEQTVNQISTHKSILAVGYQNDVRPYFAISNCLLFPSYREGFPNVVLQAGAMNLPSIVTDINGSNEIIIHNKNGLIIEVKNENAIYDAMHKIISDKNNTVQMTKNAREIIVTRYGQEQVWEAILQEYNTLCTE